MLRTPSGSPRGKLWALVNRSRLASSLLPSVASAISLATAIQPGHAQPAPSSCSFDPSYDAYTFLGSAIQSGNQFTCTVGDKIFSNLQAPTELADALFKIDILGNNHRLVVDQLFPENSSYSFSFTVTASKPTINKINTFAGSPFLGTAGFNLAASLKDNGSATQATYTNNDGSVTSTSGLYSPTIQALSLTASLEMYAGSATGDTWTSVIGQTAPVPCMHPCHSSERWHPSASHAACDDGAGARSDQALGSHRPGASKASPSTPGRRVPRLRMGPGTGSAPLAAVDG